MYYESKKFHNRLRIFLGRKHKGEMVWTETTRGIWENIPSPRLIYFCSSEKFKVWNCFHSAPSSPLGSYGACIIMSVCIPPIPTALIQFCEAESSRKPISTLNEHLKHIKHRVFSNGNGFAMGTFFGDDAQCFLLFSLSLVFLFYDGSCERGLIPVFFLRFF